MTLRKNVRTAPRRTDPAAFSGPPFPALPDAAPALLYRKVCCFCREKVICFYMEKFFFTFDTFHAVHYNEMQKEKV